MLVDSRSFYAWIALVKNGDDYITHTYIFKHKEINKFDDLSLDSYQRTDNQKTTLHIKLDVTVMNKGRIHNYSCFAEFYNNFDKLLMEKIEHD